MDLTVGICGRGTVAPLAAPLTAELARHGFTARTEVADFGAYARYLTEVADTGPDLVLALLDPDSVADRLPLPWTADDLERAAADELALLRGLVERFVAAARGTGRTLVLNTVPLPRRLSHQLIDHRSRARLGITWREFNAGVLRLATETGGNVAVIDLDPLVAAGVPLCDERLRVYAGTGLGPELLSAYAGEIGHLVRALRGRTRKCLVLDGDHTLWDGVLAEVGPTGVVAAGTLRGRAHEEFQRLLRQLRAQGVLLAISSKNDAEEVRAVLAHHPDMTLRAADFVRIRANWEPKDRNIADIAGALGLAADTLVFADDSAFERGLIRASLPEVAVVDLDDEPAGHVSALLADSWFDSPDVTAEDRHRTERYLAEEDRLSLRSRMSYEEYQHQLRTSVVIAAAADADIPRLAQLTRRTNQFNLTTLRMQTDEVAAAAADPNRLVLTISAADRFGSHGLVGAVFATRDGDELHLDNLLLSCRVLGRDIEHACLGALLAHARAAGLGAVVGHYRATPRNGRVANLYPALGFTPLSAGTFRHDLRGPLPVPPHIHVTFRNGEQP